jgi:hypothetical protein
MIYRTDKHGEQISEYEVCGARSTYGGEEKYMQSFGEET